MLRMRGNVRRMEPFSLFQLWGWRKEEGLVAGLFLPYHTHNTHTHTLKKATHRKTTRWGDEWRAAAPNPAL